MKPTAVWLAVCWCAAAAVCRAAPSSPDRDFGRYQPIIDRLPFGGANTPGLGGAQPNFATRFSLVGMVSANYPDGSLQVILLDKSAQNKTYFRAEGETIDGVKIIKINDQLPNRSVVLQQGLETATLVYEVRRAAPARLTPAMPGAPAPAGTPELNPDAGPAVPEPSTGAAPPRRIPFRR